MQKTLLLVDDEQNILISLKRIFEDGGYNILTAISGAEGLKLLANNTVQVIISDQHMPNMTGTEFLAQVRKFYPETIRILLTGYADFEAIKDAINEGSIYKYLTKPWDNDSVQNVVKDAFKAYAQRNRSSNEIKKEANAEIKRLQDEFLSNMSHEIRTPLAGIIGYAQMLCGGRVDPNSHNHKEFLESILITSQNLSQLLLNILDLTQIQSGQMTFNPELIDLTTLIHQVKDTFANDILHKKIHIKVTVDPMLTNIMLDSEMLKKILFHYLSNAIKFSPDKGKIEISVFREPENKKLFCIKVKDNGTGIPPEEIKNLFTQFKQLDMSTTKKYQGGGLGLAIVRGITEALGGTVSVDSTPGKGSIFYVVLPCKPQFYKKKLKRKINV